MEEKDIGRKEEGGQGREELNTDIEKEQHEREYRKGRRIRGVMRDANTHTQRCKKGINKIRRKGGRKEKCCSKYDTEKHRKGSTSIRKNKSK